MKSQCNVIFEMKVVTLKDSLLGTLELKKVATDDDGCLILSGQKIIDTNLVPNPHMQFSKLHIEFPKIKCLPL